MSRQQRIPLRLLVEVIPASLHTIYAYASRGAWSTWLTRLDDNGNRGRHLLVDVPAAVHFWRSQGRAHVADRIEQRAHALTNVGREAGDC
jgi:hypothetical protein